MNIESLLKPRFILENGLKIPVDWWENRLKEDMPMFVKGVYSLNVYKVDSHFKSEYIKNDPNSCLINGFSYRYKHLKPATQEEFEAYINKSKQQS